MKNKVWLFALVLTIGLMATLYRWTSAGTLVPPALMPARGTLRVSLPADKCVTCHNRVMPTIVEQWAQSTHALKNVLCSECHEVAKDYATAKEHFGTYISATVTPATCAKCHEKEAHQYAQSRHSIPAWTALVGYAGLTPECKRQFDEIGEIRRAPEGGQLPTGFVGATRNALYTIEGPAITKLACETCHQIGRPNRDGSIGNCNSCHLRHEFSLEQARKPDTCSRCHIGPDHPQWEIYEESSHGILYHTQGHRWNWTQQPGRLSVADIPAATCQTCHMSGLGTQPTTHDVGDRLSWYLFAETSSHRPTWEENRQRMKEVCSQCHGRTHIDEEYAKADALTEQINGYSQKAKAILEGLERDGFLTTQSFDHPAKYIAFDLWHHYGRTAKFGAWMQGPDYTQWHGAYPMLNKLAELMDIDRELRGGHAAASRPASEKENRP